MSKQRIVVGFICLAVMFPFVLIGIAYCLASYYFTCGVQLTEEFMKYLDEKLGD